MESGAFLIENLNVKKVTTNSNNANNAALQAITSPNKGAIPSAFGSSASAHANFFGGRPEANTKIQ